MGKVVKLEPAARGGRTAARARGSRTGKARGAPKRSKTALVLGGGGFTGSVYEIGALRAIDLLSVHTNVNEFDIYVGTSAGAAIAALVANGITPDEVMRVVLQQPSVSLRSLDVRTLLQLNLFELARKTSLMPLRAAKVLQQLSGNIRDASVMDVLVGLAQGLPTGFYTGAGLEDYLKQALTESGRSDDFRSIGRELYITATDLDTCERVVFGREGLDDVPISRAVRASGALPVVYAPVQIGGRELIDGGIASTTNLDIAVEAGAKFIVVVNPMVPFVNDFSKSVWTLRGMRPRRVSDFGFPQIAYQSFKLLAYQRLHEMARQWEERYPGVDVVLIEPEPDDELMFQTSIMSMTSRVDIARHGFQSVTLRLAGEYDSLKEVCARHGIEISATRVSTVVRHFAADRGKTSAWRRILEQTTGSVLRQSGAEEQEPTAVG